MDRCRELGWPACTIHGTASVATARVRICQGGGPSRGWFVSPPVMACNAARPTRLCDVLSAGQRRCGSRWSPGNPGCAAPVRRGWCAGPTCGAVHGLASMGQGRRPRAQRPASRVHQGTWSAGDSCLQGWQHSTSLGASCPAVTCRPRCRRGAPGTLQSCGPGQTWNVGRNVIRGCIQWRCTATTGNAHKHEREALCHLDSAHTTPLPTCCAMAARALGTHFQAMGLVSPEATLRKLYTGEASPPLTLILSISRPAGGEGSGMPSCETCKGSVSQGFKGRLRPLPKPSY